MAQTAALESITYHKDGSISVVFMDGSGIDFPCKEALDQYIGSIESDPDQSKKMLLGLYKALDDTMSSPELILGKQLTFDPKAITQVSIADVSDVKVAVAKVGK